MILLWLLGGALFICAVTALLGRLVGARAGWFAGVGLALATVVLTGQPTEGSLRTTVSWLPSLGINLTLRLDALGLLFGLVVLGIGSLVMFYAGRYLKPGNHWLFYALLSFFPVAMLLLVLANDIVLMWVAWEFTTICSFLLIAQTGPKGRAPALRTFLVTAAGGLSLLAAICIMWAVTGTTQLDAVLASPQWGQRPELLTSAAVLVAIAAFTKAAQFPFHAWLPDAMVASTPVSAYLHAAAMVKAGIFLLLRFSGLFHSVTVWHVLLIAAGLVTALLGAVFALQRFDLKELLAYSTISQLGFLVATIGVGTSYAIMAAIVHVVAHALFKAALFMSVGLVDYQTGTRDIRILRGLAKAMPVTSILLTISAASMAGLPPLFGFISKEALFKGLTSFDGPAGIEWLLIALPVIAASLTFAYSARMVFHTLPGPPMTEPPREAPWTLWAPVAVATVGGVVLGFVGFLLAPWVAAATTAVTGTASKVDLSLWHGVNLPLVMSVAVIVIGALLVWQQVRVSAVVDRLRLPWRAIDVVDGFRERSIAAGEALGRLTRSDAPFRHLVPPLVIFAALGILFALNAASPLQPSPVIDWLLCLLVAMGVGFSLRAHSRVALVTTVGVVGFALALYFFVLGAPDVALAQLLVETLTVAMLVMLLVRLPVRFHATQRGRRRIALVVALLVGAAGFGLSLLVLSAQAPDPLGAWFTTHAYELTGGRNVVNTILVDFRALDTLGELTALGAAGIALTVALHARGLLPLTPSSISVEEDSPARPAHDNNTTLRVVDRFVGPLLLVMSIWFYFRGHQAPGGGFIAALVGAAGIMLIYLSASDDQVQRLRTPASLLIGLGIAISTLVGIAGWGWGGFLKPADVDLYGLKLSSILVFELGVFLGVLGLVMAAVSRLGVQGTAHDAPVRERGDVTVKGER